MPIGSAAAAAAAFLLCSSSSSTAVVFVDAFAQRAEDTGSVVSSGSGGSRSRAAAVALASTTLNPLRGSLNTRTATKKNRRSAQLSSSTDDFASRVDDASSALVTMTPEEKEQQLYDRRSFLSNMLSATTTSSVAVTAAASTAVALAASSPPSANAYEQTYPNELKSTIDTNEIENSSNSLSKLKEERISKKRAFVDATKQELRNDPLGLNIFSNDPNFGTTLVGATTWAIALWFASGSSSNPLVTPVANVIYSNKDYLDDDSGTMQTQNSWLTDRNDGYDSNIPLTLLTLLLIIYLIFGILIDRAVYFFVTDGDADVSLQLGGVCAITAAVYEIGRLATKEKPITRMEYYRDVELYNEFKDFASKRIIIKAGTSSTCHRSDVISAFRRYNPKYRRADTSTEEQYYISDIEIERILKRWNREYGSGITMSSAGFFQGISINNGADVFK